MTDHLASLGAVSVPREAYVALLSAALGGGGCGGLAEQARPTAARLDAASAGVPLLPPDFAALDRLLEVTGAAGLAAPAGICHRAALGPDVVDRVLDDVERRRFLVEPAREHPAPAFVRPLHVELDERAGQLLILPTARSSRTRAGARSRPSSGPTGPASARTSRTMPLRLLRRPRTATRWAIGVTPPAAWRRRCARRWSAPAFALPASSLCGRSRRRRSAKQQRRSRRASRLVGGPGLVIAGRGRPDLAAAERSVGPERGHRAGQIRGRRLSRTCAPAGAPCPGRSSIVPLSHACQSGGTRLPSLSAGVDHPARGRDSSWPRK